MDKLLSVIIPSCDMEAFLPKCLDSVLCAGDSLAALDVIVVNDGSTDRTGEIAHDFERRYPGVVRVIDKANGHYGSAVNAGLAAASGLYVKNLDADDTFAADGLSSLLSQIAADCKSERTVDLYLTDYDHVNSRRETTLQVSFDLPSDRTLGMEEVLSRTATIHMHAVAWRLKLLRDVGYRQTEGIAYSDTEWILYPTLQARTVRYLPKCVYRYWFGREGQSVSSECRRINVDAWGVLLDRAVVECRTRAAEMQPEVRRYWLRVIVYIAQMHLEAAFLIRPIGTIEKLVATLYANLESVQAGLPLRVEDELRIMQSTVNVPYARVWRKLPWGKTLWVLLVRGYLFVARGIMKLRDGRGCG